MLLFVVVSSCLYPVADQCLHGHTAEFSCCFHSFHLHDFSFFTQVHCSPFLWFAQLLFFFLTQVLFPTACALHPTNACMAAWLIDNLVFSSVLPLVVIFCCLYGHVNRLIVIAFPLASYAFLPFYTQVLLGLLQWLFVLPWCHH